MSDKSLLLSNNIGPIPCKTYLNAKIMQRVRVLDQPVKIRQFHNHQCSFQTIFMNSNDLDQAAQLCSLIMVFAVQEIGKDCNFASHPQITEGMSAIVKY